MISMEDILAHENQELALAHFAAKRGITGPDGMNTRQLSSYWAASGARICEELRQGTYQMGVVRLFERLSGTGKKRQIASINAIDRMVERMVQQILQCHFDPLFCNCSYAYREGKGPLAAAMQAREYLERGYDWLCEIDLKDFFDEIPHDALLRKLSSTIQDDAVLDLLRKILTRFVEERFKVKQKRKGIIQGSSTSPLLSNVFMNSFDQRLETCGMPYIRFGDNIYVFAKNNSAAAGAYNALSQAVKRLLKMPVNVKKSGVFKTVERRFLGYDFRITESGIDLRKHSYQLKARHSSWHQSVAFEDGREIHIVQDGVLNKQDYSLLFENSDEKHHIPVEVVDQLNIYGDVCVSPSTLRALDERGIRLSYFDKYGNLSGVYTPVAHERSAQAFLKQCKLYSNDVQRLTIARTMQDANLSNMQAILRYYIRRAESAKLFQNDQALTKLKGQLPNADSVDALMIIEARARRIYYSSFDPLTEGTGFSFVSRTKRPPKNELNALISFGNTILYNKVLQQIWKTPLDPKIGIVHATNRRAFSLNLDFADLFKPIIVDRTILSLVRRREIKTDLHFRRETDGSVLLNEEGKRVFITAMERKLRSTTKRRGGQKSYSRLIADEVDCFRRMILQGERYKPYKHY